MQNPWQLQFEHIHNAQSNKAAVVLEYANETALKLGLRDGDTLTAINDISILNCPAPFALKWFYKQPVPFKASFSRPVIDFDDDDLNESEDNEQSAWMHFGNSNSTQASTNSSSMRRHYLSNDNPNNCESNSLFKDNGGVDEFVIFDDVYSDDDAADQANDDEAPLYDQEYEERIDQSTKDLVSGYLRGLPPSPSSKQRQLINILTAKYVWNDDVYFDGRTVRQTEDADAIKVCTDVCM